MRRNDPGLTGGLAAGPVGGGRFSIRVLAIVVVGVLFGYLSCLHGQELNAKAGAAFAAWSAGAIVLGFLVTWLFKYLFILALLLVAALWYTNSPTFRTAASEARSIRTDLCQRITFEFDGVPYKEWIC